MKIEIRDKDHAAILDKHFHERSIVDFAGLSLAVVEAEVNYQPYQPSWTFVFAEVGKVIWDGEGLPPVGTVCEHRGLVDGKEWTEVEIVAHRTFDGDDYPCAVFVYSESSSHSSSGDHFRRLRTPDEIETEDRNLEIEAMAKVLGVVACDYYVAATALYDAGYRKQ